MNTAPSHADPTNPSGPPNEAPARPTRRRFNAGRRAPVRRTRTGGWWVALVAAAVMLLLLLIFVLQNGGSVRVAFMGAHGNLPLGIALLLAATAGVLIVAIPGTGRIIQLRHLARRQTPSSRPGPSTPAPPTPAAPANGAATAPETSSEQPPGQPAG
jgi:uncharacterized integral membrane protein